MFSKVTGLRMLAILAALTVCGAVVSAQTTETQSGESTATAEKERPEPSPLSQIHYENRVRSFREQNLPFQNVVLLGDSITEAFDATKYLPGQRVINRGIGSDVIGNSLLETDKRGVLKRLDESVFDCSPTHLFIMIGINDLAQGHSSETVLEGYREMLTKIREQRPSLPIHLQSVLPTRGKMAHLNPEVVKVNEGIEKLAQEFDCGFIDLHSRFKDENGELKEELTRDGVHLKEEAYLEWRDLVKETLDW